MSGTEPHGGGAGGDGSAPQLPELPGITIEHEIARGGMGVVYRGRQDFLDRRVAVKFLSMDLGGDDFAKRFQREAKILAGINHPNIVACHMADTTPEGQSYLVMEFIDGPNLKAWIEQNGALSPMAALRLVRSAGAALAHAHAVGIIHRDVKPENVLLEAVTSTAIDVSFPFTPKLVDLGLARMTQEQVGMDLTVPGSVMGTPSTMSPEQFDDPDSVDFRSDIYGLGCCLYQMLVGQAPFRGAKLTDIVLRKRAEVPPNPCDENPALPAMVGAYTQRLLASNRDDRPSSYKELDEELGMVMDAVSKGTADAPADDDQNQTVVSAPSAVPPPASAARSTTVVGAGSQPAPAPRAPSTTTIVTPPADAAATQRPALPDASARLGSGGPGYTVEAEIRPDLLHFKGALSAARQGDNVNPERRSSGSQFYLVQGRPFSDNEMSGIEGRIANFSMEYGNGLANVENGQFVYSDEAREMYKTVGGTPFLDMQYTVFGYVVEGLDIVDSIAAVPTDRRRGDRPLEDVVMSMKRLN